MKHRHHTQNGFTVVEVMVAAVVLTMGLLFLLNMQMVAVQGNAYSKDATEAIIMTKNTFEQIKRIDFDDSRLSIGEHTGSIEEGEQEEQTGRVFNRSWNVTGNTNMKTVTVTLSWTHKGDHAITSQTIRTR
ncbi:prepilin-type N-terminal cleavage/methylation domain-containing protein [Thermodesulfobacteriota bacterium]